MKQCIMSIFTRTPLHVGAGNSVGAVDAPIMRERHTSIPIIPGSSLKGVFSDLWNENFERNEEGEILFGQVEDKDSKKKNTAGQLLIGEARTLAFPVRSAKSMFAWVTCPMVLKRYAREAQNEVLQKLLNQPENVPQGMDCLGENFITMDNGEILLEEYCLHCKGPSKAIAQELENLMSEDDLWKTVIERLVVLSDDMFSYFVANACEVVTRIGVNDRTGTVKEGALFYQELVPSETMLYSLICDSKLHKDKDALKLFKEKLEEESVCNMIQVGGDETIGLGICSLNIIE